MQFSSFEEKEKTVGVVQILRTATAHVNYPEKILKT
jgi:hypothetical protein